MFDPDVSGGVCRLRHPGARWLSTGPGGGYADADAAFNVSVPAGFERRDLAGYATERLEAAGFEADGPTLFTGVDLSHARCARRGDVTVVATAGLSNPATLGLPPGNRDRESRESADGRPGTPGTVNLLVGTTRALSAGTAATLLATATEAKTATLHAATGFTGTTSDAVAVGCDPAGEPADFAGSATDVGASTRLCVRDAVRASLASRYADSDLPDSVAAAEYGVVTAGETEVFDPVSQGI